MRDEHSRNVIVHLLRQIHECARVRARTQRQAYGASLRLQLKSRTPSTLCHQPLSRQITFESAPARKTASQVGGIGGNGLRFHLSPRYNLIESHRQSKVSPSNLHDRLSFSSTHCATDFRQRDCAAMIRKWIMPEGSDGPKEPLTLLPSLGAEGISGYVQRETKSHC